MGVEIVWSSSTSFSDTNNVITEPVESNLVSEASPAVPVGSYHHLYITNVGDTNAVNCGFYIGPNGGGNDPSSFRDITTILSWTLTAGGLSEYGIYTIQGSTEIADFLNPAGSNYLTEYSNSDEQHTYTQGSNPSNIISLKQADGIRANDLYPVGASSIGSVELYLLIKIPDNTPANKVDFNYIFYYEEEV